MINMIDQPGYITASQYNAICQHFPAINRDKLAMLGRNVAKNIIKESYQRRFQPWVQQDEFKSSIYRLVEENKPYEPGSKAK